MDKDGCMKKTIVGTAYDSHEIKWSMDIAGAEKRRKQWKVEKPKVRDHYFCLLLNVGLMTELNETSVWPWIVVQVRRMSVSDKLKSLININKCKLHRSEKS